MAAAESMALAPYEAPANGNQMGLVRPIATAQEMLEAIREYEALKAAIVDPDHDIQMYQGRPFLKKRFWRRAAAFFGLSLDFVTEARGFDESGKLFYSVLYRATAPNGRGVTADGYCSTAEKGHDAWPEHTVRATAHTRAKNRAISDLVGGGEVSAEEMPDFVDADPPASRPARASQPARRTVTPASPSTAAKPGKVAQRWSSLQLRMRGLGIIRMTMADEVAQRVVGKDWMEAANQDRDADYDKLLAEVEAQEHKADAAKAHFDRGEGVGVAVGAVKPAGHDEIVPQELDLAEIDTGHPVP